MLCIVEKTKIYATQYASPFGLAVRKVRTKLNAQVLESAPLRCLKTCISFTSFSRSVILKCLVLHRVLIFKLPQVFWK